MGYISPYFKVARDCNTSDKCYYQGSVKYLNGSDFFNYNNDDRYYKIILVDGSLIWLRTNGEHCNKNLNIHENGCALIWFDKNGKRKPNMFGKDVFLFVVNPNKIVPFKGGDCKYKGDGRACADYILKNENMNYLYK